jgi:hypothetical protein
MRRTITLAAQSNPTPAMRPVCKTARRSPHPRARAMARLLVAASCLALSHPAAAQKPSAGARENKAQSLFEEGVEGMRDGGFDSACPKLAESYALDPSPGVLFTLAECEAAWGKVATAVEHYQSFLSELTSMKQARRDKFEERRRLALEKLGVLIPLSPELVVDLPASIPAGFVLKRNGAVVGPSEYGVSKKVDPGDYVLTAELEGKLVWERRIKLAKRDRARIEVPPPGSSAPPRAGSAPSSPPRDDGSAAGTWGYVVGGVGVLGLTTGIVTGFIALSQKGVIDDNCPDLVCNAEGRSAVTTGQTSALVSTIGFSVGLAGAAGATILFLVARPEAGKALTWHRVRPSVVAADRGAVVLVEGVF